MQFDILSSIELTSADGTPWPPLGEVARPTVYLLVDVDGITRQRLDAEIAWVVERLTSGFDLVLVWPADRGLDVREYGLNHPTRTAIDVRGEFRRTVSPDGRRAAILVDPEAGAVETITESHAAFDVGAAQRDSRMSGDRTIDLGDVQL